VFNYRKTDFSVSHRININLYGLYFVAFYWLKNSVREAYRSVMEVYRSVREAYGKCKGVIQNCTGVTQKCKGGLQKCKGGIRVLPPPSQKCKGTVW
jgi:hypothetical protein